jgi:hypothetical protein
MHQELQLREEFERAVAAYERTAPGADWRERWVPAAEAMTAAAGLSACYHRAGDGELEALWERRANEWHQRAFAVTPHGGCRLGTTAGRRRPAARTRPPERHDPGA